MVATTTAQPPMQGHSARREKKWRPGFDKHAPKVWCTVKARTFAAYPKTPEKYEEMRARNRAKLAETRAAGKLKTRRGMALADLAFGVLDVVDPNRNGRQYVQAAVGKMDGTRAAGFALNCHPSLGKWSADRWVLTQAVETEAESYQGTSASYPAYDPYAPYASDHRNAAPTARGQGGGGTGPNEPQVSGHDGDASTTQAWGWEDTL